jgi:NAD/NADP transhydrogenase beta subunit
LFREGDEIVDQTDSMLWVQAIALVLSVVIGMMTFTGSMVAVLKLHGTIASKPRIIPFRVISNIIMLVAMTIFGALAFSGDQHWNDRQAGLGYLIVVAVIAAFYGFTSVMAIGGGDMPVSISFLNSLSGFSTSAAGFMLSNKALVVAGAFVGCSGIILTLVMCNAMNRSVGTVLMGGFGEGSSTQKKSTGPKEEGTVTQISAEDVVEQLTSAKSVIIVPGYGMVGNLCHSLVGAIFQILLRLFAIPFYSSRHTGGRQGSTLHRRAYRPHSQAWDQGAICHSSGGRTNAWAHECFAGRSQCSLRHYPFHGRH